MTLRFNLGADPMVNRPVAGPAPAPSEPDACRQHAGELIHKGSCYALRRHDGSEIWLEMDRIPHHLIEQQVMIEGVVYGNEVISVEMIKPN